LPAPAPILALDADDPAALPLVGVVILPLGAITGGFVITPGLVTAPVEGRVAALVPA
jgi:hypothetical protein